MTKLEQNNLDAQVKLMKDIISNFRSIIYDITVNGNEINNLLKKRIINEADKTIILSREDFDKIQDIVINLSETSKFNKLGFVSKTAVPDNDSKLEILSVLQNGCY